jgi:hypothetical protein
LSSGLTGAPCRCPCAQISQNPALAKLSLPLLEAIGGPLIIYNNSALTSLASLEHLAVVNATGRSAPSIPIPGLKVCSPLPHAADLASLLTHGRCCRVPCTSSMLRAPHGGHAQGSCWLQHLCAAALNQQQCAVCIFSQNNGKLQTPSGSAGAAGT